MSVKFRDVVENTILMLIVALVLALLIGMLRNTFFKESIKLDPSVYQCTEQIEVVERQNRIIGKAIMASDVKKKVCIKYERKVETKGLDWTPKAS